MIGRHENHRSKKYQNVFAIKIKHGRIYKGVIYV